MKDFTNVANFKGESIDRNTQPRMPWHDVACVIYGESAQDLARHFIEYWNHAKIDYEGTKNKKEGTFLKPVKQSTDIGTNEDLSQSDSDSDDLIHTSDHGILGKGLESIDEEKDDTLEESESKAYEFTKSSNKRQKTIEKRLKKKNPLDVKKNDSINEDSHESEISSEDKSSDYYSDEEEDKNEEEDKVNDIDERDEMLNNNSENKIISGDKRDTFMENSRDHNKSKSLALRHTTGSKKWMPRNSAASSIGAPLMSEETIKNHSKPRRSSVVASQLALFEDVDIDEIHLGGGDNDMIEKMKDYVNREYMKRSKGMGRLKIKKIWKKVRGKDLNEEKERNEIRKKFILEHLNAEQKMLFEKELLEAALDDDDIEGNDPKFEIAPKLGFKSAGT